MHEFSAPRHRPVQIVIEGRDFQGNATSSLDLRTLDADRVSVVIGNRKEAQDKGSWAAKSAFVGFFLGWLASLPVQRNVGRVRNGALPFQNCTLSNGQLVDKTSETAIGTLNTHGYIFPLTHSLRNGFFFNDDHSATAIESDYAFIGRGRVIDKAARLTRLVLLEELLDDVELNPDNGQLEVSVVKSIEGRVESRINQEMTGRGEISGITAYIDPAQNILEADELKVKLEVVPKGTNRKIIADLGFVNPLINQ